MIIANVVDQSLSLQYDGVISDSVRFLTVHFNFNSAWNDTAKTVIFKNGSQTYGIALLDGNGMYLGSNICLVPQEIIKSPSFTVSVYGVNGQTVITTSEATVYVEQSGMADNYPADPTQSLWQQMLGIANNTLSVAQSVRNDADLGRFNGAKGDKGDKGDTGEKGDKGDGIPSGGEEGQILRKKSNSAYDIEWANNDGSQSVLHKETKTIHLGNDVLGLETLGVGWTKNDDAYTHTSGNTNSLTFSTTAELNNNYILKFNTTLTNSEFVYVGIGSAYKMLVYNGSNSIVVPLKAIGNTTLYITPYSTSTETFTISNIKLQKIQASGGEEVELDIYSTYTNNHTENYGFWNTLLGDNVAESAVGTTRTVALGYGALNALQGGHRNIAIGTFAMSQALGGEHNISIGADSMLGTTEPKDCVVIGKGALYWGKKPLDNVAIGTDAMKSIQNATDPDNTLRMNVCIGTQAGYKLERNSNVMIGYTAGYKATKSRNNVIIGASAQGCMGDGNNTFIGANITTATNVHDSIGLGKDAKPTKNNQMMLGSSAVTEVVFCGDKKINFNADGTVTWESLT